MDNKTVSSIIYCTIKTQFSRSDEVCDTEQGYIELQQKLGLLYLHVIVGILLC